MHQIKLTSEEGKSVVVQCSPNTLLTMERDEKFRSQVFQNSLTSEQDFVPIPPVVPQDNDVREQSISVHASEERQIQKAVWLDGDCLLLISLYKELYPKLGKNVALKTKRKLWEQIAEKMNEQATTNFSSCQVEGKWKSLERAFKNKMVHNKKTGNDRATCPYEKELADVLLNRPSIAPAYLLGSTIDSGVSRTEILQQSGINPDPPTPVQVDESNDPVPDPDETQVEADFTGYTEDGPPPKKFKRAETIAGELSKWRQQFMEDSQQRKEYRKEKLRAYKERTEELKKSREKTEKFLEKLSESNKNLRLLNME
ncbi:uncharacterized protein LOC129905157 [Episyrphus balteatus]|uniref:uncharacterized protein LOC129905157 n=1 Tax=Episyrphus balteatus TaxID=286459 RepID=UPI002485E7AA|nr:uncharacterized protein LOC129905157 [Episyrphus balteatus]